MSKSSDFYISVKSAAINNDINGARDAFNTWQVSQCYNPRKQRVYDSHLGIRRIMSVPCGTCYHCRETKINSWVTRMYAHVEDFKNVYFVTLTYRPFSNSSNPVNKLMLDYLQDAVYSLDSRNTFNKLSFNPCLLVKSHYQNFLKRLRYHTGIKDLTYILSGEYGHDFGRPHFHLILFTNSVITPQDIKRAWSVRLWRDNNTGLFTFKRNQRNNGYSFDFPIGHVDFNDLVSNGTFNTTGKIKVDGSFMSAARCFSYVCKYVCKADDANFSRVSIAYNLMFHKTRFVKCFTNEVEWSKIKDYLNECGYSHSYIDSSINNLKRYTYEKNVFKPSNFYFSEGFSQFKKQNVFGKVVDVEFYPSMYIDFRNKFSPFCEFSRGCPIGSIYAKRHLQEFAQGIYNKPLLQTNSFIVPNYFRLKAKNKRYGLRICNATCKSVSYNKSNLPLLLGRFEDAIKNGYHLREYISRPLSYFDIKEALHSPLSHFKDFSTGEKVILYFNHAQCYKYNRHTRKYEFVRAFPLAKWLEYWSNMIKRELIEHDKELLRYNENERLSNSALNLLSEFVDSPINLRNNFVKKTKEYLTERQKLYHSIHKSVE